MKKSRYLNLLSITAASLLLVALFGGLLATAQSEEQVQQRRALIKLTPWVLAHTANGNEAEFLVMMAEQANLGSAAVLRTKAEKGRFVRDVLWAKAQATQRGLRNWLAERGIEHRSFYIVNAVLVKASREVALEIAARADVARLDGNPKLPAIQPIGPIELGGYNQLLQQSLEPGVSHIRAPEVWAQGFTGQGIVIGGQDTGVQWDHPALRQRYRGTSTPVLSHDYNWHDSIHTGGGACGPNSPVPCDDNNHGTHTLGSAVGDDRLGNQIGVAPGAKFIACRNMDRGNGTPATYLECFEFFLAPYPVSGTPAQGDVTKAPDLTVNSWGCPPSEGCQPETLRAAVEAQRAAGIMTIVSAGNAGAACSTVVDPPAHYAASYTVGALDAATGGIATFSARGPVTLDGSNRTKPDITAPGVGVRSAIRNNGFAFFSGTSMAAPHVAGAVALLWSARPELRHQVALTERLLNESAVRVETTDCGSNGFPNNVYGYGRLDVKAALDLASANVSPLGDTFSVRGGDGAITVTAAQTVNWRVASNSSWINITSAATNIGSSFVTYRVAENASNVVRTGTISVAGRLITITQAATATLFNVSGRVTNLEGGGFSRVTLSFARVSGRGAVPGPVVSGDDGRWSQSGFEPGTIYRVTAVRSRQSFDPVARDFSAASTTLDFRAADRRVTSPARTAAATIYDNQRDQQ